MTCTKIYLFRVKIAMKAKLKYSTNLRIWATKLDFCSFYLNSVAFFRCNGIFALVHFVLRPFDVTIIVSSFFAQMINRIQYHTIDRPVPFRFNCCCNRFTFADYSIRLLITHSYRVGFFVLFAIFSLKPFVHTCSYSDKGLNQIYFLHYQPMYYLLSCYVALSLSFTLFCTILMLQFFE